MVAISLGIFVVGKVGAEGEGMDGFDSMLAYHVLIFRSELKEGFSLLDAF